MLRNEVPVQLMKLRLLNCSWDGRSFLYRHANNMFNMSTHHYHNMEGYCNSRMPAICLIDMHGDVNVVERDVLGNDIRHISATSSPSRRRLAVDGSRPGLEIYAIDHVGLHLRVEADELLMGLSQWVGQTVKSTDLDVFQGQIVHYIGLRNSDGRDEFV